VVQKAFSDEEAFSFFYQNKSPALWPFHSERCTLR